MNSEKTILEIIKKDYPEKYKQLRDNVSQLFKMFTREEWLTILTKSRSTFDPQNREIKKN